MILKLGVTFWPICHRSTFSITCWMVLEPYRAYHACICHDWKPSRDIEVVPRCQSLLCMICIMGYVDIHVPWSLCDSILKKVHGTIIVVGRFLMMWLPWCKGSLFGIELAYISPPHLGPFIKGRSVIHHFNWCFKCVNIFFFELAWFEFGWCDLLSGIMLLSS